LKRAMAIEQYWSLSKSLRHKEPYTPEEATAKLGSLLKENLDSCSQKPKFATHLHDTLGSDIITWLVAHTQPREQVDTYTPIFEEKESTILKGSEQFAKKLSLRHHSKRILVDAALDELPRLVWHLDEPLADPNCLQTWALGRQVKESGATLVLDLGWRELLAGHEYYFANSSKETSIPFAYTLAKIPPFLRDQILFPVLRYTNERLAYRMLRNIRINRDQIGYLAHTALFKEPIRKKAAPQLYPTFDPEVFTQRFHSITAHNDEVHPSLYYDLKTALPNHTLIQYNRLLAPFGVDCEMPFLRNSLLDFAFSLPDSVKFASKEPGSALLSLWNHLTCEKSQYAPPPLMAPSWSNHPRLRTLFTALEKGRLAEEGFISGRWLHEMNQMRDLTDIAFRELWSILILEVWFRLFINRPIAMADHEVKTETLLGC
nr:asparagine synthase C-terminal domain-containing protein [Chlamydiota bacterium]